jgi:hypothetical protein
VIKLAVPLPDLDTLPHDKRSLLEALHRLYRSAGMPSSRQVSEWVRDNDDFRDTVSQETVIKLLNGDTVPKWSKLEPILLVLTQRATDKPQPETVIAHFQELWLATQQAFAASSPLFEAPPNPSPPSNLIGGRNGDLEYPAGLVVEKETARLYYTHGRYEISIERVLRNDGEDPLQFFDLKIAVDRYPNDSARSAVHHRAHPLMWDEMALEAFCDDRPMDWLPRDISEKEKRVRLRFGNEEESFPLRPGHRSTILYRYTVSDAQWGRWFQRTIRIATESLTIEVDLPTELRPVVWSLTKGGDDPFRSQRSALPKIGRSRFLWTPSPVKKGLAYKQEWSFAAPAPIHS